MSSSDRSLLIHAAATAMSTSVRASTSVRPELAARSRRSVAVCTAAGSISAIEMLRRASRIPTSASTRSLSGSLAASVRACSRLAFARRGAPCFPATSATRRRYFTARVQSAPSSK